MTDNKFLDYLETLVVEQYDEETTIKASDDNSTLLTININKSTCEFEDIYINEELVILTEKQKELFYEWLIVKYDDSECQAFTDEDRYNQEQLIYR